MLRRRKPMPRGKAPVRKQPIRTSREKRTGRRDTGPDRTTRDLVLERDDWRCVACGALIFGPEPISPLQPYSIQHRVARQMGGTKRPEANSPANLILLCGSATTPDGCHWWCERRSEEARDGGYWLPSWEDPAEIPVRHSTYGLVYLLDDGTVRPVPHVDGDAS